MPENHIANLFRVKSRFLRSVHLERDFRDPNACAGYIPTAFSRTCVSRIAAGLQHRSAQRAWRVTGDYGSGKSALALLLAHSFSGHTAEVPIQITHVIEQSGVGKSKPKFVPVLATCSREPLAATILKALHQAVSQIYRDGEESKAARMAAKLLNSKTKPLDDEIVSTILDINQQLILNSKGHGLLLILDELGKFLEFAALNSQQEDVFLLQRLGEASSRSGDHPFFLVCLLHQGFSDYAAQLDQAAQREWEKVAGRFEEIVFNQPVEQVAEIIASSLNVRTADLPRSAATRMRDAMKQTVDLGWVDRAKPERFAELSSSLYPLHPTVLPVLIRVFRRFGQNERSLFSFLLSNEPFGLQTFSQQRTIGQDLFRLHNLYDYVRANFGHRLTVLSYRSHWTLIESVIESFATEDDLHVQILKTVGILNLLNDGDLLPTEESVVCAINEDSNVSEIKKALDDLRRRKRVIYDRGRARGLCLWPHTSVDIEKALEDARRVVEAPGRVADSLSSYLQTRSIVARRHYIETGNLRHYAIRYCSVLEMAKATEPNFADSDGVIVIPLCETNAERSQALQLAKSNQYGSRKDLLIAITRPLGEVLRALLHEVLRWEWVSSNTPELNADKFAREEVSRQKLNATANLESRIHDIVGLKQTTGSTSLTWFHQGENIKIGDGRHLLEKLSEVFDDTYYSAPIVNNELINRRNLSSAAAAARMRLIERMFANEGEEFLGMDSTKKPPEMSMYLSVLKRASIHALHEASWKIGSPALKADRCNVLPALTAIRDAVKAQIDARIPVSKLIQDLRQPPYGVRDGLIPILLATFAMENESEIAFYKDGSFIREMSGNEMLQLTKSPEKFEIQYCRMEGVRAELFGKLIEVLELTRTNEKRSDILDVVRPLCTFVAQLTPYVHNTKQLSAPTIAVRDSILSAREPGKLIFTDLPKSCGFDEFQPAKENAKRAQGFVKALKTALNELQAAWPELNDRIKRRLREAFDLPGTFPQFRSSLAAQAERILVGISEPKLKAFCFRLMDDNLQESDWLESLGSFLALKPPSKWHDAEETLFSQELRHYSTTFRRVESIVFASGKRPKGTSGIRIALTREDGKEYEQVIHCSPEEEARLLELEAEFETMMDRDQRLAFAAASRALWKSMHKGDSKK